MNHRTRMYDLLCLLKHHGVEIYDEKGDPNEHWFLPKGKLKHKFSILKQIYRFLGGYEEFLRSDLFRVRRNKSCKHKNCVNPDCYTLYMRCDSRAALTKDDYQDLLEEIDLDRYYEIGPTDYLREINAGMPDFLRIDTRTLTALVEYKRKHEDD